MKMGRIFLLICVGLFIVGCKNTDTEKEMADTEELSIFPTPENVFVGDPMPYFDGEKMNIFFLADERAGTQGYHPWARYTTTNFYDYDFLGEVIPYGSDIQKQDIALGTGSVIKDAEGLYHAFYTGHNDTYSPKEAIMHATSEDMQNWEKQEEDTFYADVEYSADDFRDPYVFYNQLDEQYWMLITTRRNNMGVIALYKSADLKGWNHEKVLFENDMGSDSNLECPSLIEWNGYWYLTFSDQWPDRIVHYRMAQSPEGPFEKTEVDYFDGNGFYAGRMEKMHEEMYLIGWNATKAGHQDESEYIWGGNLVSHQIIQGENGRLHVMPIQSVIDKMNQSIDLGSLERSETITEEAGILRFSGKGYEVVSFPKFDGSTKISGTLKVNDVTNVFGFAFNLLETKVGTLNIVFNKEEAKVGFYNWRTDTFSGKEAQSEVDFVMNEGDEIEFVLLIDKTVATLYINNEIALTARMYAANRNEWGFFGIDSNISIDF